jgi:hydroxymethylpyrimidine/phosphomethylpyrimidine kinase
LKKIPTVLSIAGSDPSGGAGIQADLKSMTAIGVYGAAAITCLTVQNSCGVQDIKPLAPDFVRAQIQAVLDDHMVTHIKIGMLGSVGIVAVVADILQTFTGTVVYDPVLAATTGESLLAGNGLEYLSQKLLPYVSFLTPNIHELETLTNHSISTATRAIASARELLEMYSNMQGVVVTGGHLDGENAEIKDSLVMQNGSIEESKRKRINTSNLHGTGCTYASALASFLCLDETQEIAFQKTGMFMDKIIRAGIGVQVVDKNTNGPLLHNICSI